MTPTTSRKSSGQEISGTSTPRGSVGLADERGGVERSGVTIRDANLDGFGPHVAERDQFRTWGNWSATSTRPVPSRRRRLHLPDYMLSGGTLGFDIAGNDLYLWGNQDHRPAGRGHLGRGQPAVRSQRVTGCAAFDGITLTGYTTFAKAAENTVTGCDAGIWMDGSGDHAHLQSSDVSGNCDGSSSPTRPRSCCATTRTTTRAAGSRSAYRA